jgi:hypothetical protein
LGASPYETYATIGPDCGVTVYYVVDVYYTINIFGDFAKE